MRKCFVLGAGFSKAVANLPLMRELTQKFWDVLEKEKGLGHNNRVSWGEKVKEYFDSLEYEFFRKPCIGIGDSYSYCNFQENFEAILSFIDINLSGEIRARKISKNGEKSDYTKSHLFSNYGDSQGGLRELRSLIETYTFLSLIEPEVDIKLLKAFTDSLSGTDNIATFNYDLVLDDALYKRGDWHPEDGYGITFNSLPEKIRKQGNMKSKVHIYKLHGSLNWEPDYGDQIRLSFCSDDQKPTPSDDQKPTPSDDQKPTPSDDQKPTPYEGACSGSWIMPSFIKYFSVPLLDVWQKACDALNIADEIIVIGYSLPEEDSTACLLLGTNQIEDKKLIIVDPNANVLQENYKAITKNQNPELFCSLADYLGSVS